uniref:Uncharacterized protein n=1 Tax=Micrurus carvalhoi TaxID=3147026 RepID=A0A2H6N4F9_9SAUR
MLAIAFTFLKKMLLENNMAFFKTVVRTPKHELNAIYMNTHVLTYMTSILKKNHHTFLISLLRGRQASIIIQKGKDVVAVRPSALNEKELWKRGRVLQSLTSEALTVPAP